MARNTRRLFSTTSLIALALAASAAFPLSVQAIGGTPPPDTSNTSANTSFDQFSQPNANYIGMVGLSGDGSTLLVKGYLSNFGFVPYLWKDSAGASPTTTGDLSPSDINEDGSVYVGSGQSKAYRVKNGVIEDLGTLGGAYAYARYVSDDGNAVAGQGYTANSDYHAFYWSTASGATADGVMVDIGMLNGDSSSYVYAISGDGTTVVGYSGDEAFR